MNHAEDYEFFRQYMTDQEYVLWTGKPEKGNLITAREWMMLPFCLIWLSFALFWEYTVIRTTGSLFMILWGIPFVGVGLYLLAGRFLQKASLRKKTFYMITNKKLMIRQGSRIQMCEAEKLPPMSIVLYKNGCGTLRFGEEVYTRQGYRTGSFLAIENISDVAQAQNAVAMMER